MIAPEKLRVTYLRALVQEEDANGLYEMGTDSKRIEDDEDLRDKNETLKDIQENPYIKSPKKAKIR